MSFQSEGLASEKRNIGRVRLMVAQINPFIGRFVRINALKFSRRQPITSEAAIVCRFVKVFGDAHDC
jgi:hypothetical protein